MSSEPRTANSELEIPLEAAIAFIVGPRWISIAAHAGPESVSLWIAAALFAAPLMDGGQDLRQSE